MIIERKIIDTARWEFRNAAHHSGTATSLVPMPGDTSPEFFRVTDLPATYASATGRPRAAGIANSGLHPGSRSRTASPTPRRAQA
ncbi:MAG: hypothetical protein R2939_10550 [Kofleriaceae bacterium]